MINLCTMCDNRLSWQKNQYKHANMAQLNNRMLPLWQHACQRILFIRGSILHTRYSVALALLF